MQKDQPLKKLNLKKRPNQKQTLGKRGEAIALKRLQNKGFRLVTQNYHTRFGEVDIVCEDGNVLVFVEVKTRSSMDHGFPEDSISGSKLSKLRKAAEIFLVKHHHYESWLLRVDMVAVVIVQGRVEYFEHYEGILS